MRRRCSMARTSNMIQLSAETLHAFEAYTRKAEEEMQASLRARGPFLWCEADSAPAEEVMQGRIVAEFWSGNGPIKVPQGFIHDWIGSALVPRCTVDEVLALVQNYDNHKIIYQPDVLDSALLEREGDHFKIYLRLLKKKVITVVLDTDHEVEYIRVSRSRWFCRSHTIHIAEVENVGTPSETVLPADTGHGFLWRLYSYWRFAEKKKQVYTECRAISLTRDVPFGLGWIIEPIIQNLPRESLINTLEATRRALQVK
jgi:hypothetical protein